MLWLIVGIMLGFTWHWLLTWSRAKSLRIPWLAWFLLILAVVAGLSGVQNYVALMGDYEESAARNVIPVYGIQAIVPLLLAVLLLWRKSRQAHQATPALPLDA
jgi:hypothetical protein